MSGEWQNTLYYGDNLEVLKLHVKDETVDLAYLDPPFNSNATYNVLFSEQDGTRAAAQIKAFGDTWRWDEAAIEAYQQTVEAGGKVSGAMQAWTASHDMSPIWEVHIPHTLRPYQMSCDAVHHVAT